MHIKALLALAVVLGALTSCGQPQEVFDAEKLDDTEVAVLDCRPECLKIFRYENRSTYDLEENDLGRLITHPGIILPTGKYQIKYLYAKTITKYNYWFWYCWGVGCPVEYKYHTVNIELNLVAGHEYRIYHDCPSGHAWNPPSQGTVTVVAEDITEEKIHFRRRFSRPCLAG